LKDIKHIEALQMLDAHREHGVQQLNVVQLFGIIKCEWKSPNFEAAVLGQRCCRLSSKFDELGLRHRGSSVLRERVNRSVGDFGRKLVESTPHTITGVALAGTLACLTVGEEPIKGVASGTIEAAASEE
jgi:hypothetical protein